MLLETEVDGIRYRVHHNTYFHLAIPMQFNGPQPNSYDVPAATASTFETGDFVGDTRRGGSCNFESYQLIPHCNGTHTECAGHLSDERLSVHELLNDMLIPATLISVHPEEAGTCNDTYAPDKQPGDMLITKASLETALEQIPSAWTQALIIRTLPNDTGKQRRRYMQSPPPFFSLEAMQYIRSSEVKHLLVDFPSLDRTFDEGRLSTHRIFWDMKNEGHDRPPEHALTRTVTEMIYAGDEIPDGRYILNLQTAPFVADAAPSRPVLFPVTLGTLR